MTTGRRDGNNDEVHRLYVRLKKETGGTTLNKTNVTLEKDYTASANKKYA